MDYSLPVKMTLWHSGRDCGNQLSLAESEIRKKSKVEVKNSPRNKFLQGVGPYFLTPKLRFPKGLPFFSDPAGKKFPKIRYRCKFFALFVFFLRKPFIGDFVLK